MNEHQKIIANMQSQCLPGQKLLTCPYCGKICRVPEWQLMLSCVRRGCGIFAGPAVHPGEILR